MRHMIFALGLAASVAQPGFAQEATTAAPEAEYDATTVVARVNDRDITVGHMIAVMERLPEQYQTLEDAQLFPGILDQLIDQLVIANTVSASAETDSPRIKLTMENERVAMLSQVAIDALLAAGPDEAALQELYDTQYGSLPAKTEYSASHILVPTAEEAQAAIAEVNGGADFAEVAKEKSTGPSGPNGGDLGWFGEGVMVPEFQAAVLAMEVGAVSEPVQTQFGWHVIKLNETRDVPPPSLDDVREELSNTLMQNIVQSEIDNMRSNAKIERVDVTVPHAAVRRSDLIDAAE